MAIAGVGAAVIGRISPVLVAARACGIAEDEPTAPTPEVCVAPREPNVGEAVESVMIDVACGDAGRLAVRPLDRFAVVVEVGRMRLRPSGAAMVAKAVARRVGAIWDGATGDAAAA